MTAMKPRDLADLVLLAALWGASFLFMRLAAPAFGPNALAWVRVAGAALMLLPLVALRGHWPALRAEAVAIGALGLTNSALPFVLYGYAALTLPAGLAAIFNAATPMATALIAWAWLGDRPDRWRVAGLVLGFGGVLGLAASKSGLLPGAGLAGFDTASALAIGACLAATLMYGHAACYSRKRLSGVPPLALAAGTQAASALVLALPGLATWPAVPPAPMHWAAAVGLAVLCSGLAYLLYFRLLSRVGPIRASTVTFLVPVFAAFWGFVVLGERVTPAMLAGGAAIVAGTALVLGLRPRHGAA